MSVFDLYHLKNIFRVGGMAINIPRDMIPHLNNINASLNSAIDMGMVMVISINPKRTLYAFILLLYFLIFICKLNYKHFPTRLFYKTFDF